MILPVHLENGITAEFVLIAMPRARNVLLELELLNVPIVLTNYTTENAKPLALLTLSKKQ